MTRYRSAPSLTVRFHHRKRLAATRVGLARGFVKLMLASNVGGNMENTGEIALDADRQTVRQRIPVGAVRRNATDDEPRDDQCAEQQELVA